MLSPPVRNYNNRYTCSNKYDGGIVANMPHASWVVHNRSCVASSRILSTAALLPPASLHRPLISRALVL